MLKAEAEAIIDFLILDVLLGIIYFIISSYLYVGEKTIIVMSTIFVVTVPIIIVVILKAILFIKNMISNEQEIKDIIFEIGRINDKLFFYQLLENTFQLLENTFQYDDDRKIIGNIRSDIWNIIKIYYYNKYNIRREDVKRIYSYLIKYDKLFDVYIELGKMKDSKDYYYCISKDYYYCMQEITNQFIELQKFLQSYKSSK